MVDGIVCVIAFSSLRGVVHFAHSIICGSSVDGDEEIT
jgi:hypothetical protein